jgi:hypothetical protein
MGAVRLDSERGAAGCRRPSERGVLRLCRATSKRRGHGVGCRRRGRSTRRPWPGAPTRSVRQRRRVHRDSRRRDSPMLANGASRWWRQHCPGWRWSVPRGGRRIESLRGDHGRASGEVLGMGLQRPVFSAPGPWCVHRGGGWLLPNSRSHGKRSCSWLGGECQRRARHSAGSRDMPPHRCRSIAQHCDPP